ncbi:MAG TPA: D-alanine--D-alanine ligase family protein [bacterium]|nr:D-alanine--D-alanine ligase family protein [bacterium]HPN33639.1 D-alanine--D-alanine ligase family protein [bacterium]
MKKTKKKIRVAVIFGGRSGEHEVSLVSAGSILSALDRSKYDITSIGISKTGRWLVGDDTLQQLSEGREKKLIPACLPADPGAARLLALRQQAGLPEGLSGKAFDVVFPVLHGPRGEDGTIQGLLELADLPYVGAGVLGSALSMDKIMQKHLCRQQGLPVVDFLWFRDLDWQQNSNRQDRPLLPDQLANMTRKEMIEAILEDLKLPVFVKPPNMGSSVGIHKAHTVKELKAAIEDALRYDRKVLIEKSVPNARELEVSLLGNATPRASVVGEVFPSNEFYDYNAKYVDDACRFQIPADLPEDLARAIQDTAIRAFLAVECEGMARVDFLLQADSDRFYLSELNTIPGFTSISMYPKLWQASGLGYSELLDELIRLAMERQERRQRLQTSFQPDQKWYRKKT